MIGFMSRKLVYMRGFNLIVMKELVWIVGFANKPDNPST